MFFFLVLLYGVVSTYGVYRSRKHVCACVCVCEREREPAVAWAMSEQVCIKSLGGQLDDGLDVSMRALARLETGPRPGL